MATRHNQQGRKYLIGPQDDEERDQAGQRQQSERPDEEEE
jgi:hypothetical protein